MRARVDINNEHKEEFKVESGVKQGYSPSATLFSTGTDAILQQLDLRGNTLTHIKQCPAYTDDILINTRTKHSLTDTFSKLKDQSIYFGLIVNEKK